MARQAADRSRVATLLARRDIGRHKARSTLIVLLVLIPVAIMAAVAVATQSVFMGELTDHVDIQTGGGSARLENLAGADGRCTQPDAMTAACPGKQAQWPPAPMPRNPKLPAGVQSLTEHVGQTTLTWKGADFRLPLVAVNFTDPRLRHLYAPERPTLPAANQIALDRRLAQRFDLAVGDQVTLDGASYTVSQLVGLRAWEGQILVGPDHRLAGRPTTIYLYGPEPTPAEVTALNHAGFFVSTRTAYAAMQADGAPSEELRLSAFLLGLISLGALVGCLLTATIAGAAFSISIRQQRRTLALLAATGASPRTLQRVVTRTGLLLGAIGATAGVGLGTGVGVLVVHWVNRRTLDLPSPIQIPWWSLAALWLIGTTAALVAARVPARSVAKQDVLSGVRSAETAPETAHFPRLGTSLTILGAVIGLVAILRPPQQGWDGRVPVEQVVLPAAVSCILLFVGLLLASGWLLDRWGRLARGPLAVRLALRDGARNRGRAVACVAAALAVTALVSAALVAFASVGATDKAGHRPSMRAGLGQVRLYEMTPQQGILSAKTQAQAATAIKGVMGQADALVLTMPQRCDDNFCTMASLVPQCSDGTSECMLTGWNVPVVGDALTYQFLTGEPAPQAVVDALASGKAVTFSPEAFAHDSVIISPAMDPSASAPPADVTIPAIMPLKGPHPTIISPETAARYRLGTVAPQTLAIDMGRIPTEREATQIRAALQREAGVEPMSFGYETGPVDRYASARIWVGRAGLGLLLVVAAVTTMLTLTDALGSHATLAAIGASRRTLRRMAATQTLVTNGLGAGLGVLVGAIPMAVVLAAAKGVVFAAPWGWLALLVVGVPALAAGLTLVLVRPAAPRAVRID